MRFLACATLMILGGCSDDYISKPHSSSRRMPEPSEACPGGDCFGMHQYAPPSRCADCDAGGLATQHFYCRDCATRLERCAHCGRKQAKKEGARRTEAPETESSLVKAPPPPRPPAPAPAKRIEVASETEKLVVEAVEIADPYRHCHGALAFGAERESAARVRDAYRKRKEEEIAKLPALIAGGDVALYIVWGHHPRPILEEGKVRAEYFPKESRIRVTVPKWSGRRPDGGIGMDWGVDKKLAWPFVGFRAKLSGLPAGDYAFEVVEVESKKAEPRVLCSGRVTLIQKK